MDNSEREKETKNPHGTVIASVMDSETPRAELHLKAQKTIKMKTPANKHSPNKIPMIVIFIALVLYFVFGLILIAVIRTGGLVAGGIIYLLFVLGMIVLTYLGIYRPSRLASCMLVAYMASFFLQIILFMVNLIYLVAVFENNLIALLVFNFIGFIIFTLGTKFAREYSRKAKDYYQTYLKVNSIPS